MKCPFCEDEMIKGSIVGRRAKWVADKEEHFFKIWSKHYIDFKYTGGWRGLFSDIEAFVCMKCKKLISDIDYS